VFVSWRFHARSAAFDSGNRLLASVQSVCYIRNFTLSLHVSIQVSLGLKTIAFGLAVLIHH